MPPKPKLTSTKDLVPVGPRHISSARVGKHGKRDENGEKPTTTRALILRNGRHGARGTGELILMSRLTGREKLDLLAEDLVERSKKAVGIPFRMEKCLKIADSQCDVFLDQIADLRDNDLFRQLIQGEMNARTMRDPKKPDPRHKPEYVAQMVGMRIHNTFMLASAWKIVRDTLHGLEIQGLGDKNVRSKLKSEENLRDRYLAAYEMVGVLVNISQSIVAHLATTTPHYANFFKKKEGENPNELEYVFDWGNKLRDATLSFLDSIVLELCFPHETYPKDVLYLLLRDAVEESPRESKRFTQTLWDAIGDLSVAIQLQQILDAALLGPDGEKWKKLQRRVPKEYELWMEAQILSDTASSEISNYKDIIYPLEKTRNQGILDNLWNCINLNYKAVSGKNIDDLWQLEGEWDTPPQWTAFYTINNDSDSDEPSALVSATRKKHDDCDYSEPNSDSEEEDSEDEGYDTEQEDEIRDLLREAMDTAHEADWFESSNAPAEIDPFLQEDRKGNPFLKLLGSLRGRMFSTNPKLRTVPKTTKPGGQKDTIPKSQKATIEEVEDEDEVSIAPKKKKKKPKKKKKKSTAIKEEGPLDADNSADYIVDSTSSFQGQTPPQLSTPALHIPVGTTNVQSGYAYAKATLDKEKTKIKTRGDHASIFSNSEKKGFFSKLVPGKDKERGIDKDAPARHSWLSKLTKRSEECMHKLLRTREEDTKGSVKWESFLRLMRELGFRYDPSTAGSSVRFDPPSTGDKPITFHKPHPDPTLQPHMVRAFAKKLTARYGWIEEDFLKQAGF
ncbi:hypothetical protein BDQ17DRAFT_1346459 [Cyathus striatus]|nr:hypothetical protein BDQ17DRAFT_1346459 [Cyathus striatus]